jgi:signal transduction histidine kinase
MVMVIENFLTVSRIAQGRMYYQFETIDLQKIVRDMVKEMNNLASGYGIKIRFYDEKDVRYKISGDLMKMKQIVSNLLGESIRHTPKGLIDISLSFSQHGNHILLAISDTGEGATKNRLVQMFEKYEPSMGENGARKETGVELYIVKEIVKAHQGKVWAESEGLSRGMTVFVELPVLQHNTTA